MYYIYSGDLKGLLWSHLSLSIPAYPVNIQVHIFNFFDKNYFFSTVNNLFIGLDIERPKETLP